MIPIRRNSCNLLYTPIVCFFYLVEHSTKSVFFFLIFEDMFAKLYLSIVQYALVGTTVKKMFSGSYS